MADADREELEAAKQRVSDKATELKVKEAELAAANTQLTGFVPRGPRALQC